jgi:hypothetical protein
MPVLRPAVTPARPVQVPVAVGQLPPPPIIRLEVLPPVLGSPARARGYPPLDHPPSPFLQYERSPQRLGHVINNGSPLRIIGTPPGTPVRAAAATPLPQLHPTPGSAAGTPPHQQQQRTPQHLVDEEVDSPSPQSTRRRDPDWAPPRPQRVVPLVDRVRRRLVDNLPKTPRRNQQQQQQ